ncbi:hypothetical protein DKX38_030080 (mitochondrion) [Salix brachista]|uniref:Uncharacterized protein n=1 Tax=Salix brachista TaxID=2182728 RepID=A0A5N5J0C6_9ROSI|nr:hypothetical protein DKX38_030080 [Salix brachista]
MGIDLIPLRQGLIGNASRRSLAYRVGRQDQEFRKQGRLKEQPSQYLIECPELCFFYLSQRCWMLLTYGDYCFSSSFAVIRERVDRRLQVKLRPGRGLLS